MRVQIVLNFDNHFGFRPFLDDLLLKTAVIRLCPLPVNAHSQGNARHDLDGIKPQRSGDGHRRDDKQATYDYPLGPNATLTDAPTYPKLTEDWAGINTTAPVETLYQINNNATANDGNGVVNAYAVTVTQPDGTKSRQYSYRTGDWREGLTFADQTFTVNGTQETILSSSLVNWQQGTYDSPRPLIMWMTDDRSQTKRTELAYGPNHNQVTNKKEFDYGGTLLRETKTDYVVHAGYSDWEPGNRLNW